MIELSKILPQSVIDAVKGKYLTEDDRQRIVKRLLGEVEPTLNFDKLGSVRVGSIQTTKNFNQPDIIRLEISFIDVARVMTGLISDMLGVNQLMSITTAPNHRVTFWGMIDTITQNNSSMIYELEIQMINYDNNNKHFPARYEII